MTSISKADFVVEIGAGRGALTKPLARRAGRLMAIELDAYLATRLQRDLRGVAEVVAADILEFDLPAFPYCVVGNIPFGRSTAIVRKLTDAACPPLDAWLVVQQELAMRLCGVPFERESLASLRLKPFWHLELVDRIKRVEFDPPPSVDAALLRISQRGRPIITPHEAPRYLEFIRTAFGAGATIVQALRPRLNNHQLRRLAADLRFSFDAAPADLLFEQWLGIFRFVHRTGHRGR